MKILLVPILFIIFSIMALAGNKCFAENPSAPTSSPKDSLYKEGYKAGYEAALLKKKKSKKKRKKTSRAPKIWFGEMIMRVGDSKEEILSHLKNRFVVEKKKGSKDLMVKSLETGNIFGYIRFQKKKLASVARVWVSLSDPEAVNVSGALYNVLAGLTSHEIKNLTMSTKHNKKKNYEQKLIVFKTPHKNIRLSIYSGRQLNRVEVQEILF